MNVVICCPSSKSKVYLKFIRPIGRLGTQVQYPLHPTHLLHHLLSSPFFPEEDSSTTSSSDNNALSSDIHETSQLSRATP